jgi:hypothetical protein
VVLIYPDEDTTVMFGIVLIATVVLVAVLAPLYGADSRVDEVARRRGLRR